jgi:anti-sigma factor RsiW
MSGGDQSIREIDLLAYADGRLDTDPQRKAEVEAYLREHPADAARARVQIEQNAQIRARFEQVLAEPVPPRLKAVVAPQVAAQGVRRVARLDVAACLMLVVGALGWWLGATMYRPSTQVQDFLHQAAYTYRLEAAGGATVPASIDARQLDWFSKQIASELQPPDLSEYGYRLMDQHLMVRNGGRHAVRLMYATPQGRRVDLVREMRWQEDETPELRVTKDGDVTIAYWLDGPLIYGLVGQLGQDRLLELAEAVRRSSRMLQDAAPKHVNAEPLPGIDTPTILPEASHRVEPVQPPSPLGRM